MKKLLLVLLVCAFLIGSVVHAKVITVSYDNGNVVKKPIDVYLIIPTGKQPLYSNYINALMARYNTKVLDEEHISLLPSPKVGMCFVTFGDKNILRGQLKKLGLQLSDEEKSLMTKEKLASIRKSIEEHNSIVRPGTKVEWESDDQKVRVFYGVKILPGGIPEEIEETSNLGRPNLKDITDWLDGQFDKSLRADYTDYTISSQTSGGNWNIKGSYINTTEDYPYGEIRYVVRIYKLMSDSDPNYDYWAVAYSNYYTAPGWCVYGTGYQTIGAIVMNSCDFSMGEEVLEWSPMNTVENEDYTVTLGESPTMSWTYSLPDVTVTDRSNPDHDYTRWDIDYSNARDKSPCTGWFSNTPGTEYRVPNGGQFHVVWYLSGSFAYSHWYGWDSNSYWTDMWGEATVNP